MPFAKSSHQRHRWYELIPRFIFGEQLCRRSPPRLILIIEVADCATKKMGNVVLHPTYLPSLFDFFSSFFASFFAFLITFFASFLTSFFLCFDFFLFPAIASSRAARQMTSRLAPALQNDSGGRSSVHPPLSCAQISIYG